MTGAANDDLAAALGPDDSCCGVDGDNKGGCGKCMLLRNPSAANPNTTVLMMKKNRCPPWSNGCEHGKKHIDIAVPGYDNLQYSTANICGALGTAMSRAGSSVCGTWYQSGSDTSKGCSCASLPTGTAEELMLKKGCEMFTAWGWKSGDPMLEGKFVACPAQFVALVGGAFGPGGIQMPTRV